MFLRGTLVIGSKTEKVQAMQHFFARAVFGSDRFPCGDRLGMNPARGPSHRASSPSGKRSPRPKGTGHDHDCNIFRSKPVSPVTGARRTRIDPIQVMPGARIRRQTGIPQRKNDYRTADAARYPYEDRFSRLNQF
jgi:hypothetical protein